MGASNWRVNYLLVCHEFVEIIFYRNCIKAKIEYNIKDDNLKPRHVDSFNYKWYAKNMGMVKGIILKEDNLSDIKDSNNRLLFNYKLNSSW